LDRWHHGTEGLAKDLGEIIVSKEDKVTMGELRVWWWTDNQQYDTPVLYVADREFKKWWPFKNVVWWRRLDLTARAAELESFVDTIAMAEWPNSVEVNKRATELSKKGFLRKLKGIQK